MQKLEDETIIRRGEYQRWGGIDWFVRGYYQDRQEYQMTDSFLVMKPSTTSTESKGTLIVPTD